MPATPEFTPDYSAALTLPDTLDLDALTDQLQVALTGGQPSDDSPYPWPFLRLCIQEANDAEVADTETKNLAILQADYLTRRKDELDSYFLDLKNKGEFWDTPDADIQAFPAPVLFDAQRQEQYFVVPEVVTKLRRYQNLPNERTVREVYPRARGQRDKYQFVQLTTGHRAHRSLAGGLLGAWGFYTEQNMAATGADQYRVYIEAPKGCEKLADNFALVADYVVRGRNSGLPDPPLILVQQARIFQRGFELALLKTRQDRVEDANPQITQTQQQ